MNEAQIRERLRQAVGEATYPAGFTNRVEARLTESALHQSRGTRTFPVRPPLLLGLGRATSLVAAVMIVLLIASFVFGVHAWLINSRPIIPAGHDPAIRAYRAMLDTDEQKWESSRNFSCYIGVPGCSEEEAIVIGTLQAWLDDLNAYQTPTRFAALDALMRRHLALAISYNNAGVAAYKAHDEAAMNAAFDDAMFNGTTLRSQAEDVINSHQGTVATYTAAVRLDLGYLLGCVLCRQFVSQNQVSCPAGLTPSCANEIAAARLQVETFQGDLVFTYAPDSIATKDLRLQSDLISADVALNAIESALSTADQFALLAGHDALRGALVRVDSDAADISASK